MEVALLVHFLSREREREREKFIPHTSPNLPKENKSYKHQIINLKKNRRSYKLVMVVCTLDLCSSI